ncbi:MAG: hypothetical protein PHD37_06950 [Gallionellaceae bacterium]|nr:hypothetical protein [Gallionellaceae bacterium]
MYCPTFRRFIKAVFPLVFLPLCAQAAPSEEELFFKNISEVNEGDLRFLAEAPDRLVHHHQNRITLTPDSLVSGWVKLEQCHQHLDPVPNTQIVYGQDRIRALRITRAENIERAWVDENSIQMENIRHDALICIEAESRALLNDGPSAYVLRNGPYMRRFLDGYYPMRVTMTVSLGDSGLRFDSLTPPSQPGFNLHVSQVEVGYDTWFEGKLTTAIRFVAIGQ